MASSVEGRDPFLDHRLVEFVVALPPQMKYREGNGKYVLKRAMRGTLPDEILDRRKQGFGTPMPEWLRGRFGELAERTVMSSALRERGLLDMDRSCSPVRRPPSRTRRLELPLVEPLQRQRMVRPLGRGTSPPDGGRGALLATFVAGCGGSTPPPATTHDVDDYATRHPTTRPHARLRSARPSPASLCRVARRTRPAPSQPQVSGLFSANSVWNRPDVGSAAAGRSAARAGAHPGGRERDQGRASDRGSRPTPTARRCTWSDPTSAACRCTSTSPRPTARR